MGDIINKEFELFQEQLKIREQNLKHVVVFDIDDKINELMNDVKQKEVIL